MHALSMVSSSGELNNVKISNIVSARGDAMAIQLFPSNKVKIGVNIQIEDIHAGAALDANAVAALQPYNFLPNKVPRACAITVWTYTDEDSEYYSNEVEFVDKEAISAKCFTMHTECRFVHCLIACCRFLECAQNIASHDFGCSDNLELDF